MTAEQCSDSGGQPRKAWRDLWHAGIRRIIRRRAKPEIAESDRFLTLVDGVIHVGANTGQESGLYASLGLRVIWVEPDPEVFEVLCRNIATYPDQAAFNYLLTDQDDREVDFHVANNLGLSSSILDLKLHQDIWPQVTFEKTIRLTSCTIDTMLRREKARLEPYRALVLDTQGSELLVLKGAAELTKHLWFIKAEVPNFESYAGCCQLSDIEQFMARHGFREYHRSHFADHPTAGAYYDIVYCRGFSQGQ